MNELTILSIADVEASAIGDRLKAAGILKKIRDALGNLDPEKIQNLITFIVKLLDLFGVSATAQSVELLSVSEVEAAGIFDNAELWIALASKLIAFIRAIRNARG